MYEVYDLHTHSTASDGTLTPSELIQRAAQAGVKAIALTDHDTTGGLSEASREAIRQDMVLIAGVEISVTWESRVIHVLGLGIDPDRETLQQGLRELRRFRDWRAEEIGRRLEKAGIAGAYEGARAYSGGGLERCSNVSWSRGNQGMSPDSGHLWKTRFPGFSMPGGRPCWLTPQDTALHEPACANCWISFESPVAKV